MPLFVQIIVLALFFIWLAILTYLLRRTKTHYDTLVKETGKTALTDILGSVLKEIQLTKKDLATLSATCDRIEKESSLHIQKIGLLRFNPFKDTGGDQSFILSLVDAHDTGVVISGLYSRTGTRWYAKKVVKGVGFEHELSEEEKKAIQLAKLIGK